MVGLFSIFAMLLLGTAVSSIGGDDGPENVPDEPTSGDDVLQGTDGDDVIDALAGDDVINGSGGNDRLNGGDGADTVSGDEGNDGIYGGSGDDLIYAGEGRDVIFGEDGDDQIWGQDGWNQIFGGEGDDTLRAGDGVDQIYGGAGNDTLYGGAGDNQLEGGGGNDTIITGSGGSTMFGHSGDGILDGLTASAPLSPDTPSVSGDTENDFMVAGLGNDTLYLGIDDTAYGGDGVVDGPDLNGGNDTFIVGAYRDDGAMPRIMDFNQDQDVLVLLDEQAGTVAPVIEVTADPENPANAIIMLNGEPVTYVVGGVGLDPSLIQTRSLA